MLEYHGQSGKPALFRTHYIMLHMSDYPLLSGIDKGRLPVVGVELLVDVFDV